MSISRRLPNTDATRAKALKEAKTKNENVPSGTQILTDQTVTRLDAIQPLYATAMQDRGTAKRDQVGSTTEVTTAFSSARMYISHFFQVFNLGVARGKFPKQDRAFYQLNVSSDSVPSLTTHQDVTLWGENIKIGNINRVAAGGEPMENPKVEEVNEAVDSFNAKNSEQSSYKDEYDQKQEAVAALNDEADRVIKKVWDEVETYYNEEENSSRRRKCREWGIVYVSDVEHTFYITTKDATTGLGIDDVTILLLETGNTVTTANGGTAIMKSTIVDEATFRFMHQDYEPKDVVVALPSGTTVFEVTAVLTPL